VREKGENERAAADKFFSSRRKKEKGSLEGSKRGKSVSQRERDFSHHPILSDHSDAHNALNIENRLQEMDHLTEVYGPDKEGENSFLTLLEKV